MIEQSDLNARFAEDKQAALALALSVDPSTICRWLDDKKGGIPRSRIVAVFDALNLSIYDPATHVVMTHERARALEVLALDALKGAK